MLSSRNRMSYRLFMWVLIFIICLLLLHNQVSFVVNMSNMCSNYLKWLLVSFLFSFQFTTHLFKQDGTSTCVLFQFGCLESSPEFLHLPSGEFELELLTAILSPSRLESWHWLGSGWSFITWSSSLIRIICQNSTLLFKRVVITGKYPVKLSSIFEHLGRLWNLLIFLQTSFD